MYSKDRGTNFFRYNELSDVVHRIKTDLVNDKEARDRKFEEKVSDLIEIERNFSDTIEHEIKVREHVVFIKLAQTSLEYGFSLF